MEVNRQQKFLSRFTFPFLTGKGSKLPLDPVPSAGVSLQGVCRAARQTGTRIAQTAAGSSPNQRKTPPGERCPPEEFWSEWRDLNRAARRGRACAARQIERRFAPDGRGFKSQSRENSFGGTASPEGVLVGVAGLEPEASWSRIKFKSVNIIKKYQKYLVIVRNIVYYSGIS